jgi:hypothetical protein
MNRLALNAYSEHRNSMTLPSQPVTLSVEQIKELNDMLGTMRHDINNHLSLMIAAVELMRHKPATAERMMATLTERPPKISENIGTFSAAFEKTLQISRH